VPGPLHSGLFVPHSSEHATLLRGSVCEQECEGIDEKFSRRFQRELWKKRQMVKKKRKMIEEELTRSDVNLQV
jgi:hypothetical protein